MYGWACTTYILRSAGFTISYKQAGTYIWVDVDVAGDEADVREDADDECNPEPAPAKYDSAGLLYSVPLIFGYIVLRHTSS